MSEKEDVEIAERHMRVFKEMLRPDKNYIAGLSVLNEEFGKKIKEATGNPQLALDLQIDYAIEHYGILMELLKRRGYVVLAKGTVIFDDITKINLK
jgi:hypothetical protein